ELHEGPRAARADHARRDGLPALRRRQHGRPAAAAPRDAEGAGVRLDARGARCRAAVGGVNARATVDPVMRIGFLSFGHWQAARGSQTHTARDAHVQTIELAEAAEEIGLDGAFVRVHHFARQLASPFPLLAAIGARTSRIEIGTAVIDMRYENPLYMA